MECATEHVNRGGARVKEGFSAGIPIAIGYIPSAIAFGLLAKGVGASFIHTTLFSVLVYAGASQFMAINLIQTGVAATEIILATFLLNLRLSLMSASLAAKLQEKRMGLLSIIAFGITDETFSVAATRKKELNAFFVLGLNAMAYLAWVGGTILGYAIGEFLPSSIQQSMGIALYAMFVAILVPEVKKSIPVLLLAIGAGGLNWILNIVNILPSGWNLITAMTLSAVAGAVFYKEGKGEESGV